MKHADILIWCARKELSVQVKYADILIRYARKELSVQVKHMDTLIRYAKKLKYIEEQVLFAIHRLIMLDICTMFRENMVYSFKVVERTRFPNQ